MKYHIIILYNIIFILYFINCFQIEDGDSPAPVHLPRHRGLLRHLLLLHPRQDFLLRQQEVRRRQNEGTEVFVVQWRPSHACQRQVTRELAALWKVGDDFR